MRVLIDGDTIAYKCACSTQTKRYVYDGVEYRYLKDILPYVQAETGLVKKEARKLIDSFTVKEDSSLTLSNVDSMMRTILKDTEADESVVYLTGKGNYRNEIATVKPYKGSRVGVIPPVDLPLARQHLGNEYSAILVSGCEADDAIGIAATAATDDVIIAHSDKDINMIPGWHYSLETNKTYLMDEMAAIHFFYHQLLMGDSTDDIQGVTGVGDKTATKILKDCYTEFEMATAVYSTYRQVYKQEAADMMLEMGRLLWIQREAGQLWSPPEGVL